MSKSIVLDLNRSMNLAQSYWQVLADETATTWGHQQIPRDGLPLLDLGNSLAYYYKKIFTESGSKNWAKILATLQVSIDDSIYQNELINELKNAGLQLPKDAALASEIPGKEVIRKSLTFIGEVWPAGFVELSHYMSGIVIIESGSTRSLTSPTWFGAIFLGSAMVKRGDLLEISTSLLHEVGHMALFAQSALQSPLQDIQEEIYSPFVRRNRPALMVFHAQIAMARMLIWLLSIKCFAQRPENSPKCEDISTLSVDQAIAEYTACYLEGMSQLKTVSITDGGQPMMQDFEAIANLLVGQKL